MDHPLAVHNHLSAHGRWQGVVTAVPDARVVMVSLERDDTFIALHVIRCRQDANPMAFAEGADRYRGGIVEHDRPYIWNDNRTIIVPQARFSPIIVEAGRRRDHGNLATFQKRILSNRFELHRAVVANESRFILVYEGIEADEIVFNAGNPADIPTIAGVPVDHGPDLTFDCPAIQGRYGDGVVVVRSSRTAMTLDFNRAERSGSDAASSTGADR